MLKIYTHTYVYERSYLKYFCNFFLVLLFVYFLKYLTWWLLLLLLSHIGSCRCYCPFIVCIVLLLFLFSLICLRILCFLAYLLACLLLFESSDDDNHDDDDDDNDDDDIFKLFRFCKVFTRVLGVWYECEILQKQQY